MWALIGHRRAGPRIVESDDALRAAEAYARVLCDEGAIDEAVNIHARDESGTVKTFTVAIDWTPSFTARMETS